MCKYMHDSMKNKFAEENEHTEKKRGEKKLQIKMNRIRRNQPCAATCKWNVTFMQIATYNYEYDTQIIIS